VEALRGLLIGMTTPLRRDLALPIAATLAGITAA
jgi:hypothetical protein